VTVVPLFPETKSNFPFEIVLLHFCVALTVSASNVRNALLQKWSGLIHPSAHAGVGSRRVVIKSRSKHSAQKPSAFRQFLKSLTSLGSKNSQTLLQSQFYVLRDIASCNFA